MNVSIEDPNVIDEPTAERMARMYLTTLEHKRKAGAIETTKAETSDKPSKSSGGLRKWVI